MHNMHDQLRYIKNVPLKVDFAGLKGDTMSMQRMGWEFNISCDEDYYHQGFRYHFTGKHAGLGLYLYSGYVMIDRGSFMKHGVQYLSNIEMPIRACAENISMNVAEMPSFKPISFASPSLETMTDYQMNRFMSLEECCFFQPMEVDQTLIIEPSEVQKYMDAILEAQKPKQKELREKYRKKNLRDKGSAYDIGESSKSRKVDLRLISA